MLFYITQKYDFKCSFIFKRSVTKSNFVYYITGPSNTPNSKVHLIICLHYQCQKNSKYKCRERSCGMKLISITFHKEPNKCLKDFLRTRQTYDHINMYHMYAFPCEIRKEVIIIKNTNLFKTYCLSTIPVWGQMEANWGPEPFVFSTSIPHTHTVSLWPPLHQMNCMQ